MAWPQNHFGQTLQFSRLILACQSQVSHPHFWIYIFDIWYIYIYYSILQYIYRQINTFFWPEKAEIIPRLSPRLRFRSFILPNHKTKAKKPWAQKWSLQPLRKRSAGGELDEKDRAPSNLAASGAFARASVRLGQAADEVLQKVERLKGGCPEPLKGLLGGDGDGCIYDLYIHICI
jgi:hypothetical protein